MEEEVKNEEIDSSIDSKDNRKMNLGRVKNLQIKTSTDSS